MLEIKNIEKSFGDLKVLDGVSLSVNKGDVIAVLGLSDKQVHSLMQRLDDPHAKEENEYYRQYLVVVVAFRDE